MEPTTDVRNPSTENIVGSVPKAADADLQNAPDAAAAGFRIWSNTPPQEGVRIILKAVALPRQRTPDIAKILTLENGKRLADAEAEIECCGNFYEWDTGQSQRVELIVPGEPKMQKFILRQPIGPWSHSHPGMFP